MDKEEALFLSIQRRKTQYRPVKERIKDFEDVAVQRSVTESQRQASRCINCFSSFCHWSCPIGNIVPEWNALIAEGEWEQAYQTLAATNNLPEMTGRLCPALCEAGCALLIEGNDEAVTNRENELAAIEYAFENGWVQPRKPKKKTGKRVAVVGSGPSGLSCADQLNHAGHEVVVFERDAKPGGMLRYGIPDFKLPKWVIDRRISLFEAEGMSFKTNVAVGTDFPVKKLTQEFDAICLTGGSRVSRDLPIPGRELKGVYFAMEYLVQSNRRVAGETIPADKLIDAKGKRVVVIGGGDTGSDCVGTAHRQGAKQVVQIEIMPQPPIQRLPEDLWPDYPKVLRTSTSHEEGGERIWSVLTKAFVGKDGAVKKLSCVKVGQQVPGPNGRPVFPEIENSAFDIDADLIILAMGFVSPEHHGWLDELGVSFDARGNVNTDEHYQTRVAGVFAAGDMRRGQSLVTWAVSEGRKAAYAIDCHLMGESRLSSQ